MWRGSVAGLLREHREPLLSSAARAELQRLLRGGGEERRDGQLDSADSLYDERFGVEVDPRQGASGMPRQGVGQGGTLDPRVARTREVSARSRRDLRRRAGRGEGLRRPLPDRVHGQGEQDGGDREGDGHLRVQWHGGGSHEHAWWFRQVGDGSLPASLDAPGANLDGLASPNITWDWGGAAAPTDSGLEAAVNTPPWPAVLRERGRRAATS